VTGPDPDDYQFRADGLDLALIHRWLSTDAYWAPDRPYEVVARSLANSVCLGAFSATGEQVGFARAVTDSATFAWIADVYVDPAHRGRGLGRRLVGQLRDDLQAGGVYRLVLATKDAHGVYAKLGFTPLGAPDRWMEIDLR
jgi:GNAT superfamily N-acetyltransferase